MNKIYSIEKLEEILSHIDKKETGLITGVFDIFHSDHLALIREAKSCVDILIIGLDSDETVEMSKGAGKPIHSQADRLELVSELISVDYVFPILETFGYGSKRADEVHEEIIRTLRPNFVFSNPLADRFIEEKKKLIEKYGGKLVEIINKPSISSSKIAKKLGI